MDYFPPFEQMDEDGRFVGKGLSALRQSRQNRHSLERLFGGRHLIPSSVMKATKIRPDAEIDPNQAERCYRDSNLSQQKNALKSLQGRRDPKEIIKTFGRSGAGCQAGALSPFHPEIGRSMVLFYSDPGALVFDPFAGHNSRMELCVRAGRDYIGCDISAEFMKANRKRRTQLLKEFPKCKIELHEGDSRNVPVEDEIADFSITSPPYWDIEYYGDEEGQLGLTQTYKEFLSGLGQILVESFRVLKPGARAIWFVNDFRRNRIFYSYHTDTIRLARKAGFIHDDIVIVDFGFGFGDIFANQTIKLRLIPKRHEYGLVFLKPSET